MKRILPVLLLVGLAGCASTRHRQLDAQAIDRPEREGVQGAVEAPLADVNVIRTQIPAVLLRAEEAPYARPSPPDCDHLASNVQDLDDALGDDFDAFADDTNPNEQKGRAAGEAVVLAIRDTATDFIPLRSWVRKLSGAAAHDREVRAAVYAGRVRRAYLKGLGEAIGCKFPAAPKGASPIPVLQELTPPPAMPPAKAQKPPRRRRR